jgi:hypothetical protein
VILRLLSDAALGLAAYASAQLRAYESVRFRVNAMVWTTEDGPREFRTYGEALDAYWRRPAERRRWYCTPSPIEVYWPGKGWRELPKPHDPEAE